MSISYSRAIYALSISAILLLASIGVWRSIEGKRAPRTVAAPSVVAAAVPDRVAAKAELERIETPDYIYQYIINVINHGSHGLGFPGGEMEGGYVPAESAPEIACYVMELGGHRCPRAYSRDAAMYFSSVCAGCHGLDGKGLHGTYPDLTRSPLLGIERRKEYLKSLLSR